MSKRKKSLYGLIGYPVGHSLSPLMHNTAFKELGLDAVYKLFPLKEEELDGFFKGLREKNSPFFGFNVTIPYKEKVIQYLDSLSPYAQKTMAVNTVVVNSDRTLRGFNTDGPGFLTHIAELGINPHNQQIALLGAGGAARAIISVLCLLPEPPAVIRIYDIEKEKTENLLSDLQKRIDMSIVKAVQSLDDLKVQQADMLINATPVGLKETDACLVDVNLFHRGMFVYDLIYNPAETKLLKLAKKKGAKTSNGLGLLFYQGVLSFQHWAEVELDQKTKDKMQKSLLKGLKA